MTSKLEKKLEEKLEEILEHELIEVKKSPKLIKSFESMDEQIKMFKIDINRATANLYNLYHIKKRLLLKEVLLDDELLQKISKEYRTEKGEKINPAYVREYFLSLSEENEKHIRSYLKERRDTYNFDSLEEYDS